MPRTGLAFSSHSMSIRDIASDWETDCPRDWPWCQCWPQMTQVGPSGCCRQTGPVCREASQVCAAIWKTQTPLCDTYRQNSNPSLWHVQTEFKPLSVTHRTQTPLCDTYRQNSNPSLWHILTEFKPLSVTHRIQTLSVTHTDRILTPLCHTYRQNYNPSLWHI